MGKILLCVILAFLFVPALTVVFMLWVLDVPIVLISDVADLFKSKLSDEERSNRRKQRHNLFWHMIPDFLIAYFKLFFGID